MITLIEGGFFAGGHEMITDVIKRLCLSKKKSILIVPEQQTVNAEAEMADVLEESMPLYSEVTNFTRFTNTVFRSLGGLTDESADSVKRTLIMWKTLTELSPLLQSYKQRREISAGSIEKMLGAVKQMQSFSITPTELFDSAKKLSEKTDIDVDARLVSKLSDMAMIMTLYKKLMGDHFSDSDDALLLAEKKITSADVDFLTDTEFFIDGFTSFTEPQYKLLSAIMKRSDVTVFLNLPKHFSDSYEYTEIKNTRTRLVSLASNLSIDIRSRKIDGRKNAPPLLTEITALLWKNNAKVYCETLNNCDSLRIYEAETPYDECDFVAQDIKRRVISGAKYSDFGIIARNIDSFSGILDVSFEKAKIPLFTSKRSDISSYEVIKLIYSAFAVVTGGFKKEDVISYAKCSLSNVERSLADEFELYVEKWQINGRRFTDGTVWNMNPLGYTDKRRAKDEEKLLRINLAREKIISPLVAFAEDINAAQTVKDYLTALVGFMTELNVEENLKIKSEEEAFLKGKQKALDMQRLFGIICDSLDKLYDVLADSKVSPQVFLNLLKITLSATDIGRIPSFKEQVVAGSANIVRMYGKKHIYIIGANAGIFPEAVSDDSYFNDNDKRALSKLGLSINADTDMRSAAELYYFSRAISFAEQSVSILYSAKDTSFKAYSPSDAITRIRDLTDGKIRPKKLSEISQTDKVFTPEYALEHLSVTESEYSALKSAVTKFGFEDRIAISESPIKNVGLRLSRESLDTLYGQSIPMTQSKLDLYASCPMSYFCTYNLSLTNDERAEFDSRNIGNFLHSILEHFFKELKERGKNIASITEEEKTTLIAKVSKEYISKCFEGIPETSKRLEDTISKLSKSAKPIIDGLCEEFKNCEYEPIFFELEIDKYDNEKPAPIIFKTDDGKEIFITGKIDRVDKFSDGDDVYVRVIDYKSGRKVFSPSDIKNGTNLQMFLYLKSIVETERRGFREILGVKGNGRVIPAGVLYVKTAIDNAKISKNSQEELNAALKANQARLGMLLEDEKSIGAMNSEFIPVKYKKDGSFDSRSLSKLYTLSGWDAISETIENSVKAITEKMASGDIDALPLKKHSGKSDACSYCNFKAICRNASK